MNEAKERAITAAAREKYWEECDADQKAERLRDQVAHLSRDLSTLVGFLQQIASHKHGANGELLTALQFVEPGANYARGALAGGHGLYAHDNGIPHNLRREHERR